jgi:hypothetical protein
VPVQPLGEAVQGEEGVGEPFGVDLRVHVDEQGADLRVMGGVVVTALDGLHYYVVATQAAWRNPG